MSYATQMHPTLPPGETRMLLGTPSEAASAFPAFSRISQTMPASVDNSSSPSGNFGVIRVPEKGGGSVCTLMFGGTGTDNETGKAQVLVVPKPVNPALAVSPASVEPEYVAQWLADFDFTVSTNLSGTASGSLGGTDVHFADTISSTASNPTAALNVISPADDANLASVQFTHNNAAYIVVLMHRNSSLDSVTGLYMLG